MLTGFARDNGGDAVAGLHGIGVHEPGHDLAVGADVGRGDVAVGADEQADLGRVAPGQVFEFAPGKLSSGHRRRRPWHRRRGC